MRIWFALNLVVWVAIAASSENAVAATLCNAGETVHFTCEMERSRKLLSLCGGATADSKAAWLQYRYGRRQQLEMEFPSKRVPVNEAGFEFRQHRRMGGASDYEVNFDRHGRTYVIFSWIAGEEGASASESGVFVARRREGPGKKLKCRERPDTTGLRKLVDEYGSSR